MFLKCLLHAVEHTDALGVPGSKVLIRFVRDVALKLGDVQVMNRLQGLAAGAVHTLDLVANMSVAVLLGQVRG